jgi:hypothetical protein
MKNHTPNIAGLIAFLAVIVAAVRDIALARLVDVSVLIFAIGYFLLLSAGTSLRQDRALSRR